MKTALGLCGSQYEGSKSRLPLSGLGQLMVHAGSWHSAALTGQLCSAQGSHQSCALQFPVCGKMRVKEKLGQENPSTLGSYLQAAQRRPETALPPLGARSRRAPGSPLSDAA